jgi:hypothetical protein
MLTSALNGPSPDGGTLTSVMSPGQHGSLPSPNRRASALPVPGPNRSSLRRPLIVLATGTFAIGTDAFVIGGVLPAVARSLDVFTSSAGLLVTAFVLSGQGRGETIRRDLTAVPPELSGPSRLIRQRSFGPTATDIGSTESHKSPRPRAGQMLSLRGLSPGGGCRLGAGVVSGRTWRWRPG